jgi:hypothetical protein
MKITEIDFNIETGEETIIEREETEAEKTLREKLEAENLKVQAEAEKKAAQRQVILEKLGLTAEEAALLLK